MSLDLLLDCPDPEIRLEAIRTVRKDYIRPPAPGNILLAATSPEMLSGLLTAIREKSLPTSGGRLLPAEDCLTEILEESLE